jgi:hypothetical protein
LEKTVIPNDCVKKQTENPDQKVCRMAACRSADLFNIPQKTVNALFYGAYTSFWGANLRQQKVRKTCQWCRLSQSLFFVD